MKSRDPLEVLLWSIALPGFGQLLNRNYFKGLILITLEFLINVQSGINLLIISSFYGDLQHAVSQTNYLWLMFYPCVYMFAAWDAYRDAGGAKSGYSYLPFVVAAYLGTIGVIYSNSFLGPLWLPLLCLGIGAVLGYRLKLRLLKTQP